LINELADAMLSVVSVMQAIQPSPARPPRCALRSLSAAPSLKFEREDWISFRTLEGLQQKAGVSVTKLARLVMKELADNEGCALGGATRLHADVEQGLHHPRRSRPDR
jgi:hypothetical protein